MFLANENFPRPSILFLRSQGYEILSIQETFPGISDAEVMKIASEKALIILTFDRDYGELVFRYASDRPPSIVYFRVKGIDPLFVGQHLHDLLRENKVQINHAFTVIDEKSVRQRFYNSSS